MKQQSSLPFTAKDQTHRRSSADGPPPSRRSRPTHNSSATTSGRSYSPIRPSSTVPFSWEHQPGVPKSPPTRGTYPDPVLLPLPPPLRSGSNTPRKARPDKASSNPDPFAAAMAECAGERPTAARRPRAVPAWAAIANRFGVVAGLYGSCKSSCTVAEATVCVPRASLRTGSFGLLNRRSG